MEKSLKVSKILAWDSQLEQYVIIRGRGRAGFREISKWNPVPGRQIQTVSHYNCISKGRVKTSNAGFWPSSTHVLFFNTLSDYCHIATIEWTAEFEAITKEKFNIHKYASFYTRSDQAVYNFKIRGTGTILTDLSFYCFVSFLRRAVVWPCELDDGGLSTKGVTLRKTVVGFD